MRMKLLTVSTVALALGVLSQGQTGNRQPQGQTEKAAAKSEIPRTADGKPDFSGVFSAVAAPRPRRPQNAERPQGAGRAQGAGRGQGGGRAQGPQISFQPWAEKKHSELAARQRVDDPTSRCLSAGIIRLTSTAFFPLQFVQTPGQMVVLYEWDHFFRVIPTDGRPQEKDPDPPQSLGHSVGKWDGDTLIVDVAGLSDYTWIDGNAGIHSDALHIVESYRMLDADTISYEADLDDSKAWTKPWHFSSTLKRRPATDKLLEYNCAENNKPDDYVPGDNK
jgi:hypothetical protein